MLYSMVSKYRDIVSTLTHNVFLTAMFTDSDENVCTGTNIVASKAA